MSIENWRKCAIHQVVELARVSRGFNLLVDMDFMNCTRSVLHAESLGEAKSAMRRLAFVLRKYEDISPRVDAILLGFGQIG